MGNKIIVIEEIEEFCEFLDKDKVTSDTKKEALSYIMPWLLRE